MAEHGHDFKSLWTNGSMTWVSELRSQLHFLVAGLRSELEVEVVKTQSERVEALVMFLCRKYSIESCCKKQISFGGIPNSSSI